MLAAVPDLILHVNRAFQRIERVVDTLGTRVAAVTMLRADLELARGVRLGSTGVAFRDEAGATGARWMLQPDGLVRHEAGATWSYPGLTLSWTSPEAARPLMIHIGALDRPGDEVVLSRLFAGTIERGEP